MPDAAPDPSPPALSPAQARSALLALITRLPDAAVVLVWTFLHAWLTQVPHLPPAVVEQPQKAPS